MSDKRVRNSEINPFGQSSLSYISKSCMFKHCIVILGVRGTPVGAAGGASRQEQNRCDAPNAGWTE